MSVKTWKKIITITVIIIILALILTSLRFSMKYKLTDRLYDELLNKEVPETVIDLRDYKLTFDDLENYKDIVKFYKEVGDEALEYQTKYPELYVDNNYEYQDLTNKKICYLTFDDGPNVNVTTSVLNTLKKNDAHATFFVIYNDTEKTRELLKRMVDEGHTIGVHTASHNYEKIYSSVDAYLKDFKKVSDWVEEVTGQKPEIFRFPGGSVNSYNIGTYMEIIAEMLRRGYTYYDWNCSSGDAAASYVSAENIISNSLKYGNTNEKIVLMHDGSGHGTTAKALPSVILGLKQSGYELKALDKTVPPLRFDYSS